MVLGTDTLAMTQTVRVIYQLKDAHGNTMFNYNERPRISWTGIDTSSKVCNHYQSKPY